MPLPAATRDGLKAAAKAAAAHAYAPYSRFRVGAAVLTEEGTIHAGCNVEDASYGLTVCAERNAIAHAVAAGARKILAVVVYTPTAAPTMPCGACRQVLAEFGRDATVLCCTDDDAADAEFRVAELLPSAFGS
jgi:cytidine deaminase